MKIHSAYHSYIYIDDVYLQVGKQSRRKRTPIIIQKQKKKYKFCERVFWCNVSQFFFVSYAMRTALAYSLFPHMAAACTFRGDALLGLSSRD